jgi:hypothetical protein
LVRLKELDGGFDAVVDVHHGEKGIFGQETVVVALFQQVEEDLCAVVGRAVKGVLFARDDTRVPKATETHLIFVGEVLAHQLVEHLANTVNSLGLQDRINWGVQFQKIIAAEDTDR